MPSTSPMTVLASALRDRRGARRQAAVAAEIGVSRSSFARMERGGQPPSPQVAVALARWLGWSVTQVIDAANAPMAPPPTMTPVRSGALEATRLGVEIEHRRDGRDTASLAEELGIPTTTLSLIERGKLRPSVSTAILVGRWLGWSVDEVLEAASTAADAEPLEPASEDDADEDVLPTPLPAAEPTVVAASTGVTEVSEPDAPKPEGMEDPPP
jgi:DNA-binding XRE family transcriptional regulator